MKLYRDFVSQEEIDAQYNLDALLPTLQPYLQLLKSGSERARRELPCVLDVRFGPTVDETVDVFPAKKPGSPILVFIHGGYWRSRNSKDFSFIALGLNVHDITVVVMNYSLCPKVTIAEITRQSRAVIAWLSREAFTFHGDPERIFVCGHSAGGQQVGMLVATDWPEEYGLAQNIIKGGVPISGLFDLSPFRYSWLQPKLLLTHETIQQQSPHFQIPDSGPPLLVSVGEKETAEFHRQATDYLNAWRAKGLPGEMLIQAGKNHFTAIEEFAEANSPFCQALNKFMTQV